LVIEEALLSEGLTLIERAMADVVTGDAAVSTTTGGVK
jgi:hypothetical protein